VGLDEEPISRRRVDTRDELFARILDAASKIKESEDQLRRKTRDLRTRVQSGLRLTVGFSNICVTDLSYEH
jgi:hypothetical protein